jgi:O-antigen/teichoic acid export membrane protein
MASPSSTEPTGEPTVAGIMMRGAVAQQGAQLAAVAVGLVTATALGRSLSVAEFGTYGLVVSFALYVAFLNLGAATITLRWLGRSTQEAERGEAVAISLTYSIAVGIVVALVYLFIATFLLPVLSLPPGLRGGAEDGALLLAGVNLLGIPLRTSNDILRGAHHFQLAALCEGIGFLAWGALLTVAVLWFDLSLSLLIAIGGSVSLCIGAISAVALVGGTAWRVSWARPNPTQLRVFARESLGAGVASASSVMALAVDRLVLAALATTNALGLYESVVRVYNLIQQVTAALVRNVTPVSARFLAEGDTRREGILAVRGTKYLLLIVVPPVGAGCVLAEPLLVTWLGQPYASGGTALTIVLAMWLVALTPAVIGGVLYARGRIAELAKISWVAALINLAVSVSLTSAIGLEGVIIGTAVGALYTVPRILSLGTRTIGGEMRPSVMLSSWGPIYLAQAPFWAALAAVRWGTGLGAGVEVVLLLVAAAAGGWVLAGALVLDPSDRALLRAARLPGSRFLGVRE